MRQGLLIIWLILSVQWMTKKEIHCIKGGKVESSSNKQRCVRRNVRPLSGRGGCCKKIRKHGKTCRLGGKRDGSNGLSR